MQIVKQENGELAITNLGPAEAAVIMKALRTGENRDGHFVQFTADWLDAWLKEMCS